MNDSLSWIAQLMRNFDVSVLPVVDRSGMAVGTITQRDVRAALEASVKHAVASSVMTPVAECCAAGDSTRSVKALMRQHHVTTMPVSDDGQLVGVLQFDDIGPTGSTPPPPSTGFCGYGRGSGGT